MGRCYHSFVRSVRLCFYSFKKKKGGKKKKEVKKKIISQKLWYLVYHQSSNNPSIHPSHLPRRMSLI